MLNDSALQDCNCAHACFDAGERGNDNTPAALDNNGFALEAPDAAAMD